MAAPSAGQPAAVSAQAKVNEVINADRSKVPVHVFDPDASPQEKAAVAGKGRIQVESIIKDQNSDTAKELPIDTGKSNVMPTINIENADAVKPQNSLEPVSAKVDSAGPPGALQDAQAPIIPAWYKVGWRAVSGIDAPQPTEDDEKDKGVLDMFLAEQFYGEWYHNAGIIVFAVLASHFLTRFHFGWGWLFIVLAVCSTYYTTSVSRFRRRARDDIQRALVKVRLLNEHESADWINNFLDRFWRIYEPILSETIVSSVEQVLSTNTPPFLDSLGLSTFTLGNKAPRIDKVKTFPTTAEDIIVMDWGFSFTPNDISNMTTNQIADKANPKIILSIRVGKGLATASIPVLLEDITFSGLMRIRLKLMNNFPHVQLLSVSFLEKPVIDYVLKPLGGETFGVDINHIPGLSAFIREMTHATLGPMMYDPNSYTLNLEQLLSGAPLDTAIGVLRVTVYSARGIKGTKIGGGVPDPFVAFSLNDRGELARTKYRSNTYNPIWNETKFLLVNSLMGSLLMSVYDYNDHRKDYLMGTCTFALEALKEDPTREGIDANILKDGKERGQMRFDLSFYPVLKPQMVNGKNELPETTVGIVRLVLHQAKDLDPSKSITGELNPFAQVILGQGAPIHSTLSTRQTKHTNNPIWESATEFLCSDKASSIITVKVIDDRDFLKDPLVGYLSVRLADVLEAQKEGIRDWWPLSGCKRGRIRMSVEWKPLNIAGNLHGIHQYSPPIGVVKLFMDRAMDVKNVEAALGGKSDPYVRVLVNNTIVARTDVIMNNLNPKWNQFLYAPVHSLKETILLEVMDYQNLGKDRSLGTVELRVSDLAESGKDKRYPHESTGVKNNADPIQLEGNAYKGTLHYTAQFISALALKFDKFVDRPNELQRVADIDGDDGGGDAIADGSNVSTPPVPEGVTAWLPFESEVAETPQKKASTDTESSHTNDTAPKEKTEDSVIKDVELTREELLQQQSGVLVVNIVSGKLTKKARVEVVLDGGYWPAFATVKARSTNACWEHVGEGFIRELDFSQMSLRLDESSADDKDYIIAEWKGDVKRFLQMTLDGPHQLELMDKDERTVSTVELEARYVPVPVDLEPRERMSNQGSLRVDLLDGSDMVAADRGGKSDPYAVFTLDGQKVFKSQTKKKTLAPEWNENFSVPVPSRVDADFAIEVFDWNQIEQAKSLGSAKIYLADLEPFEGTERTLKLTSAKYGEKGVVRVRLLFQPEFISKSRKNTSTFLSATKTMTTIGGVPLGASKGVIHGVTGVFRKDKIKDDDPLPPVPDPPAGQSSRPIAPSEPISEGPVTLPVVPAENGGGSSEPGTLKVTVLDAKDLSTSEMKAYIILRLGSSEHKTKHSGKTMTPEWHETFSFSAGSMTPKLYIWVYDHKTLAKDKVLAEGEVDIWRHVQFGSTSSAEVFVELSGGHGQLHLRLDYVVEVTPIGRTSSTLSVNRSGALSSPSRFSIRGRRPPTINVPDQDD